MLAFTCPRKLRERTSKTLPTGLCGSPGIPAWCDHSTMIGYSRCFELGGTPSANLSTTSKRLTVWPPDSSFLPSANKRYLRRTPNSISDDNPREQSARCSLDKRPCAAAGESHRVRCPIRPQHPRRWPAAHNMPHLAYRRDADGSAVPGHG